MPKSVKRASAWGHPEMGSEIPSRVRRASMQGVKVAIRLGHLLLAGELNK